MDKEEKIVFITMEGGEGCGKTTQLRMFAEYLRSEGQQVIVTREPGGPPLAESIRALLLNPDHSTMSFKTEFFLFMAARAQHVKETIAPALASGAVVLSDRYYDSTWAYQVYTRKIVSGAEFSHCNWMAISYEDRSYVPDITFMLDIDVEVGHARALARNNEKHDHSEARFDNEKLAFHTSVNEAYRLLASADENRGRMRRIDANDTIENVQKQIQKMWKISKGAQRNGIYG
jgi:dTMP kinase